MTYDLLYPSENPDERAAIERARRNLGHQNEHITRYSAARTTASDRYNAEIVDITNRFANSIDPVDSLAAFALQDMTTNRIDPEWLPEDDIRRFVAVQHLKAHEAHRDPVRGDAADLFRSAWDRLDQDGGLDQ